MISYRISNCLIRAFSRGWRLALVFLRFSRSCEKRMSLRRRVRLRARLRPRNTKRPEKRSQSAFAEKFRFIFLRDSADNEKIQKRMDVLGKLYRDRGLPVEEVAVAGDTPYLKIFSSLILADWTAFYTGEAYGVETDAVPMVEEFKKAIS